ncbi:phosphonate metabolism protein/1,5-bisphosphokinase (PRPP-forming) PhnN [Roseomonas sp. CCTCC AB2023176]|uniref:phosphonate metabolism protein/1,5-bisphosphokinase (PRPP-forming) PhnN n=1 Tax=Roseomonas sp. CCTCC AB2023176 TaxID=3342640 RepID=UPI0035D7334E
MSGALVAVVGPSGAGKDTLMEAARERLVDDPSFVFLRRVITRPEGAGGEDHQAMTRGAFLKARDAGFFALSWDAHGLLYGIPRDPLETALDDRQVAVANLSRHALGEAAKRYPLVVLSVTAPLAVRARRLAARGRETHDQVVARLSREAGLPLDLDVREVLNTGSIEEGAEAMVAVLRGLTEKARA